MRHHLLLRVITKLLVGPIILFALYVQFHGDYSPGGGFQAGVIFAVAFILFGIVFGWVPPISITARLRQIIQSMVSTGASWLLSSVLVLQ